MKILFQNLIVPLIPLKLIKKNLTCFVILLFRAASKFENNIDHVNLDTLYSQIKDVQKNWKFVSLNEYASANDKKGICSLTIDDGYKNVIDESFDIFKSLNIPITIFINSSTFNHKIFWRDKVRFLIEKNLVHKFLKQSKIFKEKISKIFIHYQKIQDIIV